MTTHEMVTNLLKEHGNDWPLKDIDEISVKVVGDTVVEIGLQERKGAWDGYSFLVHNGAVYTASEWSGGDDTEYFDSYFEQFEDIAETALKEYRESIPVIAPPKRERCRIRKDS